MPIKYLANGLRKILNLSKIDKSEEYINRIKKAFPKELASDVDVVLDIIPLNSNQFKLSDGSTIEVENLIFDRSFCVKLNSEELSIPYRLYFHEPSAEKEKLLTGKQKAILNCIYTKHDNGYIREKHLEQLGQNHEYWVWVTPFTFQLLGEYVIEIVELLKKQLDDNKLENYKRLAIENPEYFQKTESRMVSYWNEYYRYRFPELKFHPGKFIFDKIKAKIKDDKS